MKQPGLRQVIAILLVELAVTLALALLIARAFAQEAGAPAEPDWTRPFVLPGTSFTGGALDVYRQPGIGTGYGVENGGAYTYRDRRGTATCTDTAGLITCLGSPDPDPAGFLHEPR